MSPSRLRDVLNRSFGFWALERPADALPLAEEAVGIYRALAETDPDRYRPGYARSLSNLGVWLRALGIPLEALAVTEEAIGIRRDLAEFSPGRYRTELAQSLSNLGVVYSALGRLEDALPVILEAVSACREQAKDNRARYRLELATTLDGLADVLSRMDRNAGAEDISGRGPGQAVRESPCTLPSVESVGLCVVVAYLDALTVADRHVVLSAPRPRRVYQAQQCLRRIHQIRVVLRAGRCQFGTQLWFPHSWGSLMLGERQFPDPAA